MRLLLRLPKNQSMGYATVMTLGPNTHNVVPCPAEQRVAMLRLLYDSQPASQQPVLVSALDTARQQGKAGFAGLLVVNDVDSPPAVVWAQLAAGRTAVVWLPEDTHPAASALMDRVGVFLDQHHVVLAQVLMPPDHHYDARVLAAGDFSKLADLVYLSAKSECFPTAQPASQLELHPRAGDQAERLGRLVLQTYEDSLDCPQLNGMRDSEDVLEGYRQQGQHDPTAWFFVCHQGQDVGVLLLTEHPQSAIWELVYMGIVPAMRGQGFGRLLVQYALWEARCRAAKQMVLAVDDANPHALDVYTAAGFKPWDRRTVYTRIRSG